MRNNERELTWRREEISNAGPGDKSNYSNFSFFLLVLGIVLALGAHSSELIKERCHFVKTSSINWTDSATACSHNLDLSSFIDQTLRIVVDPGHGGKDRGAQGLLGISEKWLALEVARLLKGELEATSKVLGINLEVRMTRDEDAFISLHDRVSIANRWDADLFVSIHANWSESSKPRGFELYFLSPEASDADTRRLVQMENKTEATPIKSDILSILTDVQNTLHIQASSALAETVYNHVSQLHIPSGKGVRQGPFTVLSGTAMPAILLELGFLSSPKDAENLRSQPFLRSLTSAISSGIVDFALRNRERHAS